MEEENRPPPAALMEEQKKGEELKHGSCTIMMLLKQPTCDLYVGCKEHCVTLDYSDAFTNQKIDEFETRAKNKTSCPSLSQQNKEAMQYLTETVPSKIANFRKKKNLNLQPIKFTLKEQKANSRDFSPDLQMHYITHTK